MQDIYFQEFEDQLPYDKKSVCLFIIFQFQYKNVGDYPIQKVSR